MFVLKSNCLKSDKLNYKAKVVAFVDTCPNYFSVHEFFEEDYFYYQIFYQNNFTGFIIDAACDVYFGGMMVEPLIMIETVLKEMQTG